MRLRKTHVQFVDQANKIHGGKYTYPETYAGDTVKIGIECPIHEIFYQQAASHLQGCGCPECARDCRRKLFSKSSEDFLKQARIVHGDRYEYLEEYHGARSKIRIACKIHGVFSQTPGKHLQGNGCPKCAGRMRKTKEQFVSEAIEVHSSKYTYPGEYINARTDIAIECLKHGIFLQVPDVHLNGVGCPTCSSNASKPEMRWLDSLGIPNDNTHRHCRIYIGNSYIKPDGFDPDTMTIYEFYGDYFHGNPRMYSSDTINQKSGKRCGDLYWATMKREEIIKKAGYKLVSIWESDFTGYKDEPKKSNRSSEQFCDQDAKASCTL